MLQSSLSIVGGERGTLQIEVPGPIFITQVVSRRALHAMLATATSLANDYISQITS